MKHKYIPLAMLATLFTLTGCGRDSSSQPASSEQEKESVSNPSSQGGGVATDPVSEEYTITADENNRGGTLTFSKAKAKKGETIEIHLTMDEGFYFNNITIDNVKITTVEEEKEFTFVMPGHSVVVKLNVAEVGKLVSFYDTKTVGVNMNLELGLESKPGTYQEVILTSNEVPFSSLFEDYALLVGEQTYELTLNNDEATEASVRYVVPEGEYAIYFLPLLAYELDDGGNSISFDKPDNVNVYGLHQMTGLDVSGVYFYLDGGMDYNITDVTYKLDGESEFKAFTEYTGSILHFGSLVQIMFWEGESSDMKDVTFHVEGKKDTLKDITYVSNPELGGMSSLPQKAFGGNKVFFSLQGIKEASGYSMDDYTVLADDGTEVATERGYGSEIVCFDMPNSDVTFTFVNNKMPTLGFNPADGLVDVAFYNESDFRHTERVYAVKAGKRFVAIPEIADGYGIIKCEMDGEEIAKQSDGTFVATMPDHDVVLTFTLSSSHTITINTVANGHGSVLFGKSTASAGETITVSFFADSGYVFDGVTCDGHPELALNINGNKVTFVMPDYDVVLTPVFKATRASITVTVSMTNTTGILRYYSVTGKESGETVQFSAFGNNKGTFYSGEEVSLVVKLVDATKIVSVQINGTTYEGVEAEFDSTDISDYNEQQYTFNFDGITLPDTSCTISFAFSDRPTEETTD